jgi:hypothetical protein
MKTNKLIKVKISIETEIVVINPHNEDINIVARKAWFNHCFGIMHQANEEDVIIKAEIINKLEDLPKGWDGDCLPWNPGIYNFGKEKKIWEIL